MTKFKPKSNSQASGLFRTLAEAVVTGLVFGLVMAIVSNLFVLGVKSLSTFRQLPNVLTIELFSYTLSPFPLLSLVLAAFMLITIRKVLKIQRWHGPADSIYAAHRTDNELDTKHGFASTLAAFVSAGGGASVGQYGPLVHFGATMGSLLRQMTSSKLTTDVFIGCGVAGAIAAGFNAPIAGVIFAHEAILRHFSLRAIAPISISSITAAWFSKWMFNNDPLFMMQDRFPDLIELLPASMAAGLIFGLVAVLFMHALRTAARYANTSPMSANSRIMFAAIITGVIGTFVPEVLGLGGETITEILKQAFGLTYLAVIFVLKIGLTSLCIGFGLFGGIFSPAIFVGAAAGSIVGSIVSALGITASGPGLAICGMAAVASAVIGAPVASVLIILEMTLSYEFALAAMLSVVVATIVSNSIFGHSFFDRQLLDRDIDISRGRGQMEMTETPIISLVSNQYAEFPTSTKVKNAIEKLVEAGLTEGYVVSGPDKIFIGKVSVTKLISERPSDLLTRHMLKKPLSIKDDASLLQSIEAASNFVGESIPVINRSTGALIGVVTEADLFQKYLSLQTKITDLEKR